MNPLKRRTVIGLAICLLCIVVGGSVLSEAEQTVFTPETSSPWAGKDLTENYWTLPMDIRDEAAVWRMLTQPFTIVDTGKGDFRTQVPLRAEPDMNSEKIGLVTSKSQGVHVLETRDDGWSLIECYSSSFAKTTVEMWNLLVQGYVRTEYLKTVEPDQHLALLVDKLTQRMYVFVDGKLFSTLLVSTGHVEWNGKKYQPYNETRSGEFLLVGTVGAFSSGNMVCSLAVRFNAGDMMHEVPYIKGSNGNRNYAFCENKLGTKASHGCIRVQRKKTPEGVNMKWLWDEIEKCEGKVKLAIWEDWQGRQIPVPAGDTVLYRDPAKPGKWHRSETCYAAEDKILEPFTYAELDREENAGMTACPYCCPERRSTEIAEINQLYAPGGDHDELMTQLRQEAQEKRDKKKEREKQKQQNK